MNKIKVGLPKWATIVGAALTASSWAIAHSGLVALIPWHPVGTFIMGAAGLILATFGTPPHANTNTVTGTPDTTKV